MIRPIRWRCLDADQGEALCAEIVLEHVVELGDVVDGDGAAGHGDEFIIAQFGEGAGKRFTTGAEFGGEDTFGAGQGDDTLRGILGMLDQPIEKT